MPRTPRLREIREREFLSQQDLADRSGTSRATIADAEAGKRALQPRTLRKIAAALGVSPEELVGDPKASAPRPEQTASRAAGAPNRPPGVSVLEAAKAAAMIGGAGRIATELATLWKQEVDRYEQSSHAIPAARVFEMGSAVDELWRQYFGALEVLQRHAASLGLDPDPSTWDEPSRRDLYDAGDSIRTLAEQYGLIRRAGEKGEAGLESLMPQLEEYNVAAQAFLAEDPAWSEAIERARAAAGIAG